MLYIIKMLYKKKQATPGTVQFNKLFAELPEKYKNIKPRLNLEMIF